MPYRHYRFVFVSILCLLLFVDEINSLRIRIPALRLSSTLGKTASCLKKKAVANKKSVLAKSPSPTVTVAPRAKVAEF